MNISNCDHLYKTQLLPVCYIQMYAHIILQSSQEQIHPKVRLCNAQWNCKKTQKVHLRLLSSAGSLPAQLEKAYLEGQPVESPFFCEKNTAARLTFTELHLNKLKDFGQMRQKWIYLAIFSAPHLSTIKQKIRTNITCQLSSMTMKGWWCGLVLQPRDLSTLYSLIRAWTPQ